MKENERYFMKQQILTLLADVIKEEFPNIKNLKVVGSTQLSEVSITFDEGEYTEKQIQDKLDEINNFEPDFKMSEFSKVEKTDFGFKIS